MKQSSKCWFRIVTEKWGICVRSLLEFIFSTMRFIRNKLFFPLQDKHHSYLPCYCKKSITQYGLGPEFLFFHHFVYKETLQFLKKKKAHSKKISSCLKNYTFFSTTAAKTYCSEKCCVEVKSLFYCYKKNTVFLPK